MTETTGLVAALAKVQEKLPNVGKGKTARVKSERTGVEYTYKYADLADIAAAIHPLLSDQGLVFIAAPRFKGDRYLLVGTLEHTSGDKRAAVFPLPLDKPGERVTPQQLGSAMTYGRRYLLCALTGVVADEDDDGAAASKPAPEKRAPARARTQPPQKPAEQLGGVNEARHLEKYQAGIAAASSHAELRSVGEDIAGDNALSQASRVALRQQYDTRWKELDPEAAP